MDDAVARPDRMIELALAAHAGLLDHLDEMAAGIDTSRPSLLPGWTQGHVLTHLARNADGLLRVLDGAERGESAEQYVGGAAARNEAIEVGSVRPFAEQLADVRASAEAFDAQLRSQQRWSGGGVGSHGQAIPTVEVPFLRAREVLVHHADLGDAGFGPRDWPAEYVREELRRQTMAWNARKPMGRTGLPDAALAVPELDRLVWLLGRGVIEGLQPAGTF